MVKHAWLLIPFIVACGSSKEKSQKNHLAPQWEVVELAFNAENTYENPYTDVEMYVEFKGSNGQSIRRPAFWDGGKLWKVRFASPVAEGTWRWLSHANTEDSGLDSLTGELSSVPSAGVTPLTAHGLLQMSPGHRNVVHADGTPFFLVGDTPWALPYRATPEQVHIYADDRQQKGFNAALLMTVQPDQEARGPRQRNIEQGFAVGFEDLSEGHLNELNPGYFQYFDTLTNILINHGIVPVYQPVFHGFGWKGKNTLGPEADPREYARYCRYLVARYGAQPAIWLVSGDNTGLDPSVEAGGREVEDWDDYRQPAGIHYNPFDDYCPPNQPDRKCFHHNKSHQDANWLDFQWCQTGHNGEHLTHKVERMYENEPTKAVANGEPTYERMRDSTNAAGWWQGEEAWMQLMAGGTMGVVYGAAGLWQWKVTPNEPGWDDWANARNASWRDALGFEGSTYVGYVSKVFQGTNFTDMLKHPELAGGNPCLAKPGEFYVSYLPSGGSITLLGLNDNLQYRWFNPKTGEWNGEGPIENPSQTFNAPDENPWVLMVDETGNGE